MARNQVQFQEGMSEADFDDFFGAEDKCWAHLVTWRRPRGFECPKCGERKYCIVGNRRVFQCAGRHTQTSVTAGTIFASTKLPLKIWFRAIYHITQTKGGVSSIELDRRLGVTQNTARKITHKLMQVMLEREDKQPLYGRIEMDDAYLGGKRVGGERGRGAAGKAPFVAAVETNDDGRPTRMKLCRVGGFSKREIHKAATRILDSSAVVVSDGLTCFTGVTDHGRHHEPVRVKGKKQVQDGTFKWGNTVLGNVKNATLGTCRAVRMEHVSRYLSSFAYRFNRRYDLAAMFTLLAWVAVRTTPMPYRLLKLAEDGW